jgi:hypothetical protein
MADLPQPAPVPLPPGAPDFRAADNALLEGLRARGLDPQPDGEKAWQTGVPGLRLERGEAMAMKVETRSGDDSWFGHAEFLATLDHPTFGTHRIQDLISLDGPDGHAVLTECINAYLHLTFDPIRALFDEALFAAPNAQLLCVVDPGEATHWNVYTRFINVCGADQAPLLARFEEVSMLGLVGSTLAGHLAKPQLHWFKLYGESFGAKQQFGCLFDGLTEPDGEREMQARLNLPPDAGRWSFRAFALFVPHGEADAVKAEALRAELGPQKPKPWWRFGGPKRRVIWRVTALEATEDGG